MELSSCICCRRVGRSTSIGVEALQSASSHFNRGSLTWDVVLALQPGSSHLARGRRTWNGVVALGTGSPHLGRGRGTWDGVVALGTGSSHLARVALGTGSSHLERGRGSETHKNDHKNSSWTRKMAQKHIFIAVTAGDCGFCTRFKTSVWPTLKPKLLNSGRLTVVEVQLDKMSSVNSDSFAEQWPTDLRRFIHWYPTFILCTAASWGKRDNLDGVVMNGQMVFDEKTGQEIVTSVDEFIEPNEANLTQWLSDQLRSNKFVNPAIPVPKAAPKIILTDRRQPQVQTQSKKMKFKVQVI